LNVVHMQKQDFIPSASNTSERKGSQPNESHRLSHGSHSARRQIPGSYQPEESCL
jgi:hypothetical protein